MNLNLNVLKKGGKLNKENIQEINQIKEFIIIMRFPTSHHTLRLQNL